MQKKAPSDRKKRKGDDSHADPKRQKVYESTNETTDPMEMGEGER
jgi:hypothetical protein